MSPHPLSPSDLLLADTLSREVPAYVSPEQVSREINLTCYALERGYGGWRFVPQQDFQRALTDLRLIRGPATPPDLRDRIDIILSKIPDNHLTARLPEGGRLQPSSYRMEQQRTVQVGTNAISTPAKVWEVRLDRVGTHNILFISITSFPAAKDPIWSGFIESAGSYFQSSDLMVLDLRDNYGGDDSKGYELARLFYGGNFKHPAPKSVRRQTSEAYALVANLSLYQLQTLRISGKPPSPLLHAQLRSHLESFQRTLSGDLPEESVEADNEDDSPFNPGRGYNKPIYILLNSNSASSAESSADAFEPHPLAKRVGESSAGTIHFGDIGALILPYSKIFVQIPTKANQYCDGRFIEKKGIPPDIRVSPPQDAYAFLKKHICGE